MRRSWLGPALVLAVSCGLLVASLSGPGSATQDQDKDLAARLKAIEERLAGIEEKLNQPHVQAFTMPEFKDLSFTVPQMQDLPDVKLWRPGKTYGFKYEDGKWERCGDEDLTKEEREKLDAEMKKLQEESKSWPKDDSYKFEYRMKGDSKGFDFVAPEFFMSPEGGKARSFSFGDAALTDEEKEQFEALKKSDAWKKLSPKLQKRLERIGGGHFWLGLDGIKPRTNLSKGSR